MPQKVLIAYSTKYGSTQQVAESIAESMRAKYYSIDLLPARDVKTLDGYEAVILGTPIYAGQILGDTRKFITRFEARLKEIPSALFILAPLSNNPQEVLGVKAQYAVNQKKFPWYSPVDVQIFAGALDLKKLRFPDSLIKLYRSSPKNPMKSQDNRDWKAIQSWAAKLPGILHLKKE